MNKDKIKRTITNVLPYGYVKKHIEFSPRFGGEAENAPELYNSEGERMKVFFLKDQACAHTPYTMGAGRFPRQILWDRFNRGLPIHFYTHKNIFEPTFPCKKKFGTLRESEKILPRDFESALRYPEVIGEFDALFTHSARVLDRYGNAKFVPAGSVWYATEQNGGSMDPKGFLKKDKNISIISSNKGMCELHRIRAELTRHYAKDSRVDAYGSACGKYIQHKADALERYRYSIVLENDVTPFYFTEKIMDCFAAMTVPVYIGATEIGKFFNADGIISVKLDQLDRLDDILAKCCREDYEERREAVTDNYNRVQEYLCVEDYLLRYYGDLFD